MPRRTIGQNGMESSFSGSATAKMHGRQQMQDFGSRSCQEDPFSTSNATIRSKERARTITNDHELARGKVHFASSRPRGLTRQKWVSPITKRQEKRRQLEVLLGTWMSPFPCRMVHHVVQYGNVLVMHLIGYQASGKTTV